MSARLIAIEGSDGAGKATQTALLVDHLRAHGIKVGVISFPRYEETPAGKMLFEYMKSDRRNDYNFAEMNPRAASYIYAKDRHESLSFLQSLIDQNEVVIFDRYVESNLLHQGGKFESQAEQMEFAKWICDLEYRFHGLPQIELTIYLDLPYTISSERSRRRAEEKGGSADAVESNLNYLKNSWQAGKIYAIWFNWYVVDCIVPKPDNQLEALRELTQDEIHEKIKKILLLKPIPRKLF